MSVAEIDRLLDVGSEEGSCSKASDEYQPAQLPTWPRGCCMVIQLEEAIVHSSSTAPQLQGRDRPGQARFMPVRASPAMSRQLLSGFHPQTEPAHISLRRSSGVEQSGMSIALFDARTPAREPHTPVISMA